MPPDWTPHPCPRCGDEGAWAYDQEVLALSADGDTVLSRYECPAAHDWVAKRRGEERISPSPEDLEELRRRLAERRQENERRDRQRSTASLERMVDALARAFAG